jgi:hypothetical protein
MQLRAVISAMAVIPCLFGQDASPPKLPYFDWKACPFETCRYGEWAARKPITVYDTWEENRHEIARIVEGEKVLAETGVVITVRPGIIRMDRDLPEQGLKHGETILTYAFRGEGFSAVWAHGKYDGEFDISFTKWPDGTGCGGAHCAATYVDLGGKVWWVQVKLASGRTGWLNTEGADFDCDR